jgi:hypothetical protein
MYGKFRENFFPKKSREFISLEAGKNINELLLLLTVTSASELPDHVLRVVIGLTARQCTSVHISARHDVGSAPDFNLLSNHFMGRKMYEVIILLFCMWPASPCSCRLYCEVSNVAISHRGNDIIHKLMEVTFE